MKYSILASFIAFFISVQFAHASNIIRTNAPIAPKDKQIEKWLSSGIQFGEWEAVSTACKRWLPYSVDIKQGTPFTQEGSDCTIQERRTGSEVLKSTLTGETKLSDKYSEETRTVTSSRESRDAVGTGTTFRSASVKAGTFSKTAYQVFGYYARLNTSIDIGDVIKNEFNERVQLYLMNESKGCEVRFVVSKDYGWNLGDGPASDTAVRFISRYSKAAFLDSNGAPLLSVTLNPINPAHFQSDGGAARIAPVACTAFTTLYNNPGSVKYISADF